MTRKRVSSALAIEANYRRYNGSWWASGASSLVSSSVCYDDVHPNWRSQSNGGGNFDVSATLYDVQGASGSYYSSWRNQGSFTNTLFTGLLYENFNDQPNLKPSELDLVSLGTTAIARTEPTNPSFSLARSIGELRADGLPKLPGHTLRERSKYLKNSGEEYLNVEFGWLPLVSDLRSFAKSVKNSHSILENFRKGSDRKIRRRYAFPASTWSKTNRAGADGVGAAIPWPNLDANGAAYGGNGVHARTVSNETWFSGAFRYHIPVGDSLSDKFARWSAEADKLLGVRLTPETVYQLTPWTWALDWFTNAGDVIHNINALGHDGLVLQYGYIMSKDIIDDLVTATAVNGAGARYHRVQKTLRRRVATPYGFGFDMGKLSASQDAILVALGLSHGLR